MRFGLTQLIAAIALAFAPAALMAQQPGAIDPEAQELFAELQEIQTELEPIQQEALSDPEIQAAQEALSSRIQQVMATVDPATPERIERLQSLMAEAEAAQAEEDEQSMMEIVAEAQQIEQSLQAAQAQAIQSPDLQPEVQGFQETLQEKMLEIDPAAEQLIERAQEIDQRLALLLNGGQ